jgi:hypothetical protein
LTLNPGVVLDAEHVAAPEPEEREQTDEQKKRRGLTGVVIQMFSLFHFQV